MRTTHRNAWDRMGCAPGFVYAIGAVGLDMYKLGRSKDIRNRMVSLRIGSPVALVLFWSAEVQSMRSAEDRLHRAFQSAHSHGEWFYLPGLSSETLDVALGRTSHAT